MLDKTFFSGNRKRFLDLIEKNSIAIFHSKDKSMKGDESYFDFADSNFFYFTGVEQPDSKLILYKDTKGKHRSLLFTKENNKTMQTWTGKRLSSVEAKKISGVKEHFFEDSYERDLDKFLSRVKTVYFFKEEGLDANLISYKSHIKSIKRKTKARFVNCVDHLADLRMIKQPQEIEEMRKAMKITKTSFEDVIKNISKMKNEREIEALLTYNYMKNGARHSYQPICASGSGAVNLHYTNNDQPLKKNTLILIDSGAEINNYKTDVTRTFPVSGKFTKRQKEVYEACLRVQKKSINLARVGTTVRDFEIESRKLMAEEMIKLGLIKNSKDIKKKVNSTGKFYPHSIWHFLGLDTHDIGYRDGESLKEGMVITVEPGIYIEKERIGIRIEDNILITKGKPIILSKSIPKEVKDLEK